MPTILITGIAGKLAALVAHWLAEQPGVRLVGLDSTEPAQALPEMELHTGAPDAHGLAALVQDTAAEVLIHLRLLGEEERGLGRESSVQANVLGSMEAIGAAYRGGARRIVLRSSTLVYGPQAELPAFISEERRPAATPRSTLLRDYQEVETFAAEFGRRRPEFSIVTLRCASVVGAGLSSELVRYFAQQNPRTALGFDPRIQVLHAYDAARAFGMAALAAAHVHGAFNVAAEPTLPLSRALALVGKQAIPVLTPLFDLAMLMGGDLRRALGAMIYHPDYLRFSCIGDTRRAREVLGFIAEISADTALSELHEAVQTVAAVAA